MYCVLTLLFLFVELCVGFAVEVARMGCDAEVNGYSLLLKMLLNSLDDLLGLLLIGFG